MRVAVLTVSTLGVRGERPDASGDIAAEWGSRDGRELVGRAIVGDDPVEVVRRLTALADSGTADLVLTTGGTGLSPRDVTPKPRAS
jgi:molybdopterin adenylyltransferase